MKKQAAIERFCDSNLSLEQIRQEAINLLQKVRLKKYSKLACKFFMAGNDEQAKEYRAKAFAAVDLSYIYCAVVRKKWQTRNNKIRDGRLAA